MINLSMSAQHSKGRGIQTAKNLCLVALRSFEQIQGAEAHSALEARVRICELSFLLGTRNEILESIEMMAHVNTAIASMFGTSHGELALWGDSLVADAAHVNAKLAAFTGHLDAAKTHMALALSVAGNSNGPASIKVRSLCGSRRR